MSSTAIETARSSLRTGPWLAMALGFTVFMPSLLGGFVHDDWGLLVDGDGLLLPPSMQEVWFSPWVYDSDPMFDVWPGREPVYRPLTRATFALNGWLHGPWAFGYHLGNVLLHALTCGLVWWLALRLVGERRWAVIAAVLFAVHPVHADAVANIAGRWNVLSTMWLLAGLVVLLPPSKVPGIWRGLLAAGLFSLAILSHEGAVCYVLLAPGVLAWHSRSHPTGVLRWMVHGMLWMLPLLVVASLRMIAMGGEILPPAPTNAIANPLVSAGPFEQTVGVFSAIGQYAWLLFVPAKLSCDYSLAVVDPRDGLTALSWLGIGVVLGVAVLMVGAIRIRGRWRTLAILSGLLVAAYVPASNTVWLAESLVRERYLYGPSVFALMLLAGLACAFWDRHVDMETQRRTARLLQTLAVALLLALGIRTGVRNLDWRDNLPLYTQDVEAQPKSAYLNALCAIEYLRFVPAAITDAQHDALLDQADARLATATTVAPEFATAMALRGHVAIERGDVDLAFLHLEAALQLAPANRIARLSHLRLVHGNDVQDRLSTLLEQARAHPDDAKIQALLGRTLIDYGQFEDAAMRLREALHLSPGDVDTQRSLAMALAFSGESRAAIERYERVIEIAPDDLKARCALSRLLLSDNPKAALQHARRAFEAHPEELLSALRLAEALVVNGQTAAGMERYLAILPSLDVDDPLRTVVNSRLQRLR